MPLSAVHRRLGGGHSLRPVGTRRTPLERDLLACVEEADETLGTVLNTLAAGGHSFDAAGLHDLALALSRLIAAGAIDAPREVRSGDWLAANYEAATDGVWRWKGEPASQPQVAMSEAGEQAFREKG